MRGAGAVFMLLYLQTRSLPAIMLAHFAVDFIDTANVIPKFILDSSEIGCLPLGLCQPNFL